MIGPREFTWVRMTSGAIVLLAAASLDDSKPFRNTGSALSALALSVYACMFSLAYVRLDAGIGALVLFGSVQVTMIGWNIVRKQIPAFLVWIGLVIALGGLAFLTIPGKDAPDSVGLAFMMLAGVGWGAYSLRGQTTAHPLGSTAMNFLLAIPLTTIFLASSFPSGLQFNSWGLGLAAISGIVTSGLGYTLWYGAIPELGAARAGVVQLAVPPIALIASSAVLHEQLTQRTLSSTALILTGIGIVFVSKIGHHRVSRFTH